jgi:sulfate adenylyltransferase subunit 2
VRVFPLSNWTELDVWRYIERERIELPDLYYAHEREVFERDGMWLAGRSVLPRAPASASRPAHRPLPHRRRHESCTGASPVRRGTVADVVAEVAASTLTERGATRADDRISEAAMEDRKKEGYF